MTTYQILQNVNWNSLPIDDYRQSFFIKIYCEKLNLTNPFFIQARLGTIFSCIEEIKLYINSLDYSKNSAYIQNGIEELIELIDDDKVFLKLIKDNWTFFKEKLQVIIKEGIGKQKINLINILNILISYKLNYEENLYEEMSFSIFGECDLKEKDRVLTAIEENTSRYISYLLDSGFSHLYLFNRKEYFTRSSNYGGRSFKVQFDSIFYKLSKSRQEFKVYFLISNISGFEQFKEYFVDNNINILENIENKVSKSYYDKLKKTNIDDKFLELSLESSDYMVASSNARKILDKLLDIALYSSKCNFKVSDTCIVKSMKEPCATHDVSILEMSEKTYRELSLYSHRYQVAQFNHTIQKLEDLDKSQMLQSLRYVRLTRNIISNEQKILNLWISFESLFSWKGDASVLGILSEYVPKLYAQVAFLSRLDLALQIVKKCKIKIIESKANKNLTINELFNIFADESLAIKIFKNIEDDLLQYRWKKLYDAYNSDKHIIKQLKKTEKDVSRQIRRIYFLRNKISHTGFYSDINPILTLHLMDYVQVCYVALNKGLLECTQIEDRLFSFEEIFSYLLLKTDLLFYRNGNDVKINYENLFLL
ncbi:hypothetical protein KWE21_14635 [Acinetobacter pittii]|uniref:hypothetical protein n=1 Tax=Acinetobacter pittii TaxID=48296 RepID=UPI00355B58B2